MNRTLRFQRYLATAVMSLLVLSACQHETISLRHALNAAGNNRAELEAMLEHYRTIDNDPQKLAAAQFIITNMPAHYSYHDNRIEKYYDAAYTILNTQDKTPVWQRDTLLAINDALFTTNPPQATPDAQTISSDYLIENIDKAFIQWRTLEWTRHLTFEEFCEWLLPYKIAEGQTLDAWRDTLYENIKPALYSMIPDDDEYQTVRKTTDIVRNRLNTIVKRYGLYSRSGLPLMRSDLYLHYTFGDIPDWVRLATLTYRSAGIPTVIDETPVGSRHTAATHWFVVMSDRGEELLTEWDISTMYGMGFFPEERGPKVYRNLYSINRERYIHNQTAKSGLHFEPYKHDVTSKYFLTSNLSLPIEQSIRKQLKDKYIYIAAGVRADSLRDWVVVDFGELRNGEARFTNMGREVLYQAYGYDSNVLIPITQPFLLHQDGSIEYIDEKSAISSAMDSWCNNAIVNR